MNRSLFGRMPGLCALLVGLFVALNAGAQTEALGKPELSAEERAQKQADKVFAFIKLHSVRPVTKQATPSAAAATPAPLVASVQTKAATKPPAPPAATASVQAGVRESVKQAPGVAPPELEPSAVVLAAATLDAPKPQLEILPQPRKPEPELEAEPEALRLLSKVEPEIPRQLRADFRGGAVTVQFTVQPDGSVVQAQAVQSSHKRLAAAAVTAVNQWRFAPLALAREASVDIAFSVE